VIFVERLKEYRFKGRQPCVLRRKIERKPFKGRQPCDLRRKQYGIPIQGRQPCVLRRKIERKPFLRGVSPVFFVENNMANCLIFEQTILIFLFDQTNFPGTQNLLP